MKRRLLCLGLLMLAAMTAHSWTLLLLDSPDVMAFVLSDRFWPTVFGLVFAFGFMAATACSALVFHPGTLPANPVSESELSGPRPEGGE